MWEKEEVCLLKNLRSCKNESNLTELLIKEKRRKWRRKE
jgi:hypothetical protein